MGNERPGRLLGFRHSAGRAGDAQAIYCGFALNDNGTPVIESCVSEEDPHPRPLSEVADRQRQRVRAERGVASSRIHRRLEDAADEERVEVLVWAKTVSVDRQAVIDGDVTPDDLRQAQAQRVQDVLDLCTDTPGCEGRAEGGPLVSIRASAAGLREMRWAEELAIMEEMPTGADQPNAANTFGALGFVEAQAVPIGGTRGATGAGVTVVVMEEGLPPAGTLDTLDPVWDPDDAYCQSALSTQMHPGYVMSAIGVGDGASALPLPVANRELLGSAPGSRLLLADLYGDCNPLGSLCLIDNNCTEPQFCDAGTCTETGDSCSVAADCKTSSGCDQTIFRCKRNHCSSNADCVAGGTCRKHDTAAPGADNSICMRNEIFTMVAAAEWAATAAPETGGRAVLNYSRGPVSSDPSNPTPCYGDAPHNYRAKSRILDWIAMNPPYPVVISTAGNSGWQRIAGNQNHNGLVVGATVSDADDNVFTLDDDPTNDIMYDDEECTPTWAFVGGKLVFLGGVGGAGSQTRNPGPFELPHVVASGDGMLLGTNAAGAAVWHYMYPATSYAAPKVAGLAAILMDYEVLGSNATYLGDYPEAVKAIILATAHTDVDGHELDFADQWDDRDGAGLIDAELAAALVADGALNKWDETAGGLGVNYGGFFGAGGFATDGEYLRRIEIGPVYTNTLQVAMAWNVDPGCDGTACTHADAPNYHMAFEISVYREIFPNNWMLIESQTTPDPTQNHLVVRATGTPGSSYQIRLTRTARNPTAGSVFYGIAWANFWDL